MTPPSAAMIGSNATMIWGMTNRERLRRIATKQQLAFEDRDSESQLLVSADWVFDPPLLRFMADHPGRALLSDGRAVIVHAAGTHASIEDAARGLEPIVYDEDFSLYNTELRKRERPFLLPLRPDTVRDIERASYKGAYKGVTDLLTKYLWPGFAFVLTRIAARIGLTPNMVTTIGAILCVLATWLFWIGDFWLGILSGFIFMVLDTVDGKLARCTITSSSIGNVFDHGIDLVHPPFWWWAWLVGLQPYGRALSAETNWAVLATIVLGYVVQRAIEGAFIRAYGIHIHVWRKFDSDFRLITARRNPNMVILVAALAMAQPDTGIVIVAWWTVISCIVHAVRLVQAWTAHRGGEPIRSWLE